MELSWLTSKAENDEKVLNSGTSLFCRMCTPREPDSPIIPPVHSKAMHVIWGPCGICGMVQPLPALPFAAVVSWLST